MSAHCMSCSKDVSAISNSVIFECPSCGDMIIRCGGCRRKCVNYECKCGFKGW